MVCRIFRNRIFGKDSRILVGSQEWDLLLRNIRLHALSFQFKAPQVIALAIYFRLIGKLATFNLRPRVVDQYHQNGGDKNDRVCQVQGVPYVRGRFTTYISLTWLEISTSTLNMMYPYMWTTFTAKISALGQPSSEYCNAQQIAPKTLLLTLTNFRKSRKKIKIPNFQKEHH
jgi:hypothetical protein